MEYLFAPMEGITFSTYRILHSRLFPGADEYYTPFIAPDTQGSFKPKFLRELTRDGASGGQGGSGAKVIPQLLVNSPGPFVLTACKLRDLGFDEINLNAGCPSGTVFSKHKGSGMLSDMSSLEAFLDGTFAGAEKYGFKISIKTRMGVHSTDEFPGIAGLYSRYPVSKMIIHARDRDGLYKSRPDIEGFAKACRSFSCPVYYNGNIFSAADTDKVLKALADCGDLGTTAGCSGTDPAAEYGSTVTCKDCGSAGRGAGCGSAAPAAGYSGAVPGANCSGTNPGAGTGFAGFMVGRGAAANPALIGELKGGPALSPAELREFHDGLVDAYLSEGLSPVFTVERMKQLWFYMIHMFADCKREEKSILKSRDLFEYKTAASSLFASGKFNPSGKFPG